MLGASLTRYAGLNISSNLLAEDWDARGGAASTVHVGMDFCQMRFDEYLRKEDGVIRIWILASLIGSLFAQLGGKT